MKRRIGIIFGGRSGEHQVSLMSAKSVIDHIDKNKYHIVPIGITRFGQWILFEGKTQDIIDGKWENEGLLIEVSQLKDRIDFAFPLVHGSYGEDGKLQGLFEMLDIPYAGCNVTSSALCMDKALAKDVLVSKGIPVSKYMLIRDIEVIKDSKDDLEKLVVKIIKQLGEKVFIKPSNAGSSLGISKARGKEEIIEALFKAGEFDRRILVEEIVDAREIETGVMGNSYGHIKSASVGEIITKSDFYTYDSKYSEDSGTELKIPANLSEEIFDRVKELAEEVYEALDCSGFARVDFFLERKTGRLLVNEVNTIPGFTKFSMFPLVWQKAGLSYKDIIDEIVESGYERYKDQSKREAANR